MYQEPSYINHRQCDCFTYLLKIIKSKSGPLYECCTIAHMDYFIHSGGIDLCMLIIGANESQHEHFQAIEILRRLLPLQYEAIMNYPGFLGQLVNIELKLQMKFYRTYSLLNDSIDILARFRPSLLLDELYKCNLVKYIGFYEYHEKRFINYLEYYGFFKLVPQILKKQIYKGSPKQKGLILDTLQFISKIQTETWNYLKYKKQCKLRNLRIPIVVLCSSEDFELQYAAYDFAQRWMKTHHWESHDREFVKYLDEVRDQINKYDSQSTIEIEY